MDIEGIPPMNPPRNRKGVSETDRSVPPGPPAEELVQLESAMVEFGGHDPAVRGAFRDDLSHRLGSYLAHGFLERDSRVVIRKVDSARHATGVEAGVTNLALAGHAVVFGFLDCQGVGDTFYVCHQGPHDVEYYAITIESGTTTGGPYDIFVTDAMDWVSFKDQLPGM